MGEVDFRNRIMLLAKNNDEIVELLNQYLACLKVVASLNLIPDYTGQLVYIIPRRDYKLDKVNLNVQVGYRGYLHLANKTNYHFTTNIVYKDDILEVDLATNTIKHQPNFNSKRLKENILAVYSLAKKNDLQWLEIMSFDEIEEVKLSSAKADRNGKFGAWEDYWGEMARKTVFKRLIKKLDLSNTELAVADSIDNELGYKEVKEDAVELIAKVAKVNQESIKQYTDEEESLAYIYNMGLDDANNINNEIEGE